MTKQHCISVALTGLPNAGKSTLMNALIGQKVSIVTPKAQTTRTKTLGIFNYNDTQMVFIDTPGLLAPEKALHRTMMKAAWSGVNEAEYGYFLIDAKKPNRQKNAEFIKQLAAKKIPLSLILNKVDVTDKAALLKLTQELMELHPFEEVFMISALRQKGLDAILQDLEKRAPETPWIYEADALTDMNDNEFAAELTREKLMMLLQEELPYGLKVDTESFEEIKGKLFIKQVITVERDPHRIIVLGKRGSKIKEIGMAAREAMKHHYGMNVDLRLFVKVDPNWSRKS